MSQALSSPTALMLSKDLRFEHGDARLASCPGRHNLVTPLWYRHSCLCAVKYS